MPLQRKPYACIVLGMELGEKLEILAASARCDASFASSGSDRRPRSGGIGAGAPSGVCHSFSGDGRCISLLKVLYSNACRNDCAYCANRASSDIVRTSFSVDELVRLTLDFYRRNYIEGLFLSSGIFSDPDIVMERLIEVARVLRVEAGFGGYIHLKAIPGAGERLLRLAGLYADRLSINIELPTAASLVRLAPEKSGAEILGAMRAMGDAESEHTRDSRRIRHTPNFAPAGQSTQLIVGASPESDRTIILLASSLYRRYALRRVYYSAFMPVAPDPRLPAAAAPPLLREHRLYQCDWLLRFYGFKAEELVQEADGNFPTDVDPKVAWALAHRDFFPLDVNSAHLGELLRVPGIGLRGARRIVATRRQVSLGPAELGKLGIVMKKARWFLSAGGRPLCAPPEEQSLRLLLAEGPREVPGASKPGPGRTVESQMEFAFP